MSAYEREATQARLAELRAHMEEAGELDQVQDSSDLDVSLVLEQKMKLVFMPGADTLYAVPSEQDWMHDALGETRCIPGTFYGDGEPFVAGSVAVTGYFQADKDGRWVRVVDGAVACADDSTQVAWRAGLEEFPEVMEELQACMNVSEYRHVAEQAAMKALVGA